MLQRWLDEGCQKKAKTLEDRDSYLKGAEGMTQYLQDWNNTWDGMEKDAEARRKA